MRGKILCVDFQFSPLFQDSRYFLVFVDVITERPLFTSMPCVADGQTGLTAKSLTLPVSLKGQQNQIVTGMLLLYYSSRRPSPAVLNHTLYSFDYSRSFFCRTHTSRNASSVSLTSTSRAKAPCRDTTSKPLILARASIS